MSVFTLSFDHFSQCARATGSRRSTRNSVAEPFFHTGHQIAIAAAGAHQHPPPALRAAEVIEKLKCAGMQKSPDYRPVPREQVSEYGLVLGRVVPGASH